MIYLDLIEKINTINNITRMDLIIFEKILKEEDNFVKIDKLLTKLSKGEKLLYNSDVISLYPIINETKNEKPTDIIFVYDLVYEAIINNIPTQILEHIKFDKMDILVEQCMEMGVNNLDFQKIKKQINEMFTGGAISIPTNMIDPKETNSLEYIQQGMFTPLMRKRIQYSQNIKSKHCKLKDLILQSKKDDIINIENILILKKLFTQVVGLNDIR